MAVVSPPGNQGFSAACSDKVEKAAEKARKDAAKAVEAALKASAEEAKKAGAALKDAGAKMEDAVLVSVLVSVKITGIPRNLPVP